ncbi:undecaprenyl-diphosphatase UppP [Tuwongella immobilis]|uniref:Undecaprenyl-diphosphatase n=1 Tax=Tuwongella immobilis TaxID=692036 RepID=A0A6C2YSL9_9BACT|nr:undecaprenyl-diphosphatase UppP [Tuwongella immobilis]VIP03872.1 udp pyrophosphate phosphatase : Undecaprenyl-diphosphatase OS=Chlorobium sp. GBChlB GN=uppP PE=3 SV=1: BacA [Tuwongella immobilis]VTS05111.1 udp pyrophosphate phosphatase : Undecaprenyl-diphosphatase OS=Chlorobium sp. GBChlB GN=uppP PE=3 SV=1: BacA [Tuwongella immobilis]
MQLQEAIVQGIVQGLTEFLPISSSAHLKVVPAMLGWPDPGAAFTAVIQLGTLVAVFWYFRQDVTRLAKAALRVLRTGRIRGDADALQLLWMVVGTLPIVLGGVLFKRAIETHLRALTVTAIMLVAVGLLMAMSEWWSQRRQRQGHTLRSMEQVRWWHALLIGCAQAVALIPGTSRSGATITAGLFLGCDRPTAARYSFLLSLPAISAAGIYQLISARHELLGSSENFVALLVASVIAGFVGYASIAFLLGFLQRRTMLVFVIYRIGLAALLIVGLNRGWWID